MSFFCFSFVETVNPVDEGNFLAKFIYGLYRLNKLKIMIGNLGKIIWGKFNCK